MNGRVYYNENDPFAAAWLRELIADGLIAAGEVDTRSICDVAPADLRGFTQVHLFAGIGGWSYALRLAGWPDDRLVWTASFPCQPYSAAGKQLGATDERNLWPVGFKLIAACKPEQIFGEQVEAAVRLGWLDGVFGDLEGEGYACGASVLGAHSVGAPHIRQRIYWLAERLGDTDDSLSQGRFLDAGEHADKRSAWPSSEPIGMADAVPAGRPERRASTGGRSSPWRSTLIPCADGKLRRVPANETGEPEPTLFPLAHGISNRVGTLRGAGNAIVPQVAAEFIKAYCDVIAP